MSKGRGPHVTNVTIPELGAVAASALLEGNLASAVAAVGERVTIFVTFNDDSVYRYDEVPAVIALSVQADPNGGAFESIKFWPGYRRVR